MARALRSRLASDERGVTVVEVLVTIFLVAVVGAIAATSLVQGMHTSRYSQDRGDALQATLIAVERVSRELRAADPLRTAEPDFVALDVRRDGRLFHYRYEVRPAGDGWELAQELWRFDDPAVFDDSGFVPTSSGADVVSESVLVPRLAADSAFTFFDDSGQAGASAAATRRVQLVVERTVQGDETIEVETTVRVRNA